MRSHVRFTFLTASWLLRLTAAQCYNDEGVDITTLGIETASEYAPCGVSSVCCAINRTSGKDQCISNGLCVNAYPSNGGTAVDYYRNFCSDPTGKGCLSACPRKGADDSKGIRLTPCGSSWNVTTKWCCGTSNSCCNNPNDPNMVTIQVDLAATLSTTSISSQSASIQTAATSSSSSTSSPGSLSTSNPVDNGISKGAVAGIAVGGTAGAAALLVLSYLMVARWLKKRREGKQSEVPPQTQESMTYEKLPQYTSDVEQRPYQQPPQELSDTRPVAELNG